MFRQSEKSHAIVDVQPDGRDTGKRDYIYFSASHVALNEEIRNF